MDVVACGTVLLREFESALFKAGCSCPIWSKIVSQKYVCLLQPGNNFIAHEGDSCRASAPSCVAKPAWCLEGLVVPGRRVSIAELKP